MGTAHDGLATLLVIINETESDFAGSVLSEKLEKSVPKDALKIS